MPIIVTNNDESKRNIPSSSKHGNGGMWSTIIIIA